VDEYSADEYSGEIACIFFEGWIFPEDPNPGLAVADAYRRHGSDFPNHLNGEYATVIRDGPRRRLVLTRDSTGSRNLYYSLSGGRLRFSGDLKTMVEAQGSDAAPDEHWVSLWMASIPDTYDGACFRDVRRVLPGHSVIYQDGGVRTERHFRPENVQELRLKDTREYADGLREALRRAVADRVNTSETIGCHLSGGLDSGSVAALASQALGEAGRRLWCFTSVPAQKIDRADRFTDEGDHAASVVSLYPNARHVLVRTGTQPVFATTDLISTAGTQPVNNPRHCEWICEIARQARLRGVGTMLLGMAGNMTISFGCAGLLGELLSSARLIQLGSVAGDLRAQGWRWRTIAHETLGPFLPRLEDAWFRLKAGHSTGAYAAVLNPSFAASHGVAGLARSRHSRAATALELRSKQLLGLERGPAVRAFGDAFGIARTDPTLDRQVVEFCLSVPPERFCEGGVNRSLIRDAMKGHISELVRNERRRGLQAVDFPLHLKAEMPEVFREIELARRGDWIPAMLNLSALKNIAETLDARVQAGQGFYADILMRAVSLIRFFRRWEEGTLFVPVEELAAGLAHGK
jgi:asparagine synthase (glutamine-hydrolysing)